MTIIVQVKVNIDIQWTWFGQSIQGNCQVHTLNSFFFVAQRYCILENIRQDIYAKIGVRVYCVQTALNTSFVLLSQLEDRRQLCVCFVSC